MQKTTFVIVASFLLFGADAAMALQPLPDYLIETARSKPEYKDFAAQVVALDSQCAVCHIPKSNKKAKGHGLNDFGQAFHKHLDDGAFKKAHQEKAEEDDRSDEAMKIFLSAWDKVQSDKNAAGKTFGELIKAGKLPGKNAT